MFPYRMSSIFQERYDDKFEAKELTTKYREDECVRLNVKKLIVLAFVPVGEVPTAFDLVAAQFDDNADDLLDYFEKTEPRRRECYFNTLNLFSS